MSQPIKSEFQESRSAGSASVSYKRQSLIQSQEFLRSSNGSNYLSSKSRLDAAMRHLGYDSGTQTNDTVERLMETTREGSSVLRDSIAFAIATQLKCETNINSNLPIDQPHFEYYTFVMAEGKENDTTSTLKIGDTINFVKVYREALSNVKHLTWLCTIKPIVDPTQYESSSPLSTTSI